MEGTGPLNIPSSCTDVFYAYKMPRISVTHKQGIGKTTTGTTEGDTTEIANLDVVAASLNVPHPEVLIEWFGKQLGVEWREVKTTASKKYVLMGQHQPKLLQEVLDSFIVIFVCCSRCKLPELKLCTSKEMLQGNCNACGHVIKFQGLDSVESVLQKHIKSKSG